jgi:hypothetical protein
MTMEKAIEILIEEMDYLIDSDIFEKQDSDMVQAIKVVAGNYYTDLKNKKKNEG